MADKPNPAEPDVPVPAQPIPLVTPSPTLYGELASKLGADLDQFAANVPGFDDETMTKEFVRRKQRVKPDFVNRAVGALFGSNELLDVKALNTSEAMDDKQYVDAMAPVAQKMGAVYKRLRFTVRMREARLARTAQQIFGIAKELARDRDTSTLRSHIDDMARIKSLKVRRAPATGETTNPAPGKEGNGTTTSTAKTK